MQNKTIVVTFRDGLLRKFKNASIVSYGIVGDYTDLKTDEVQRTHVPFDSIKTFVEVD